MIEGLNKIIGITLPILLISAGFYFCIKLRFFWLFRPIKIIKSMFGKHSSSGISPFRAVTVALAGTLGVGNIVGVAGAIAFGGFGAIFWMWVSAIFAMTLKYAEITLAVSHRRSKKDGTFYGGAVFYIRDFFAGKGLDRLGSAAALLFSLLLLLDSFTTGCIIQINAAARSAQDVCGIPTVVVGIVAALVTLSVVITGAKSVSNLTNWLIPTLSIAYILLSLAVIIIKSDTVPTAFALIFKDALNPQSAVGGLLGFLSSRALRFGTMRGLLSNEAGCGTAPTAHASAEAKSPAEQGFWGIFEVFVDTILLCTLTALVIILNYDSVAHLGGDGIIMAIHAYSSTLGKWSEYLLSGSISVFGIATVLCWAHYGSECMQYLFKRHKRSASFIYLIIYAGITVFGSCISPSSVWGISDLAIGGLTLINIAVLFLMRHEITKLTDNFFKS